MILFLFIHPSSFYDTIKIVRKIVELQKKKKSRFLTRGIYYTSEFRADFQSR